MSFTITCPNCHTSLEAEEEWIGQECQCAKCDAVITVKKTLPRLRVAEPSAPPPAAAPASPTVCHGAVGGTPAASPKAPVNRMLAVILAILAGTVGLHLFYTRQYKAASIRLAAALVLFLWGGVIGLFPFLCVAILEAVLFAKASDAEFQEKYVEKDRGWF